MLVVNDFHIYVFATLLFFFLVTSLSGDAGLINNRKMPLIPFFLFSVLVLDWCYLFFKF